MAFLPFFYACLHFIVENQTCMFAEAQVLLTKKGSPQYKGL